MSINKPLLQCVFPLGRISGKRKGLKRFVPKTLHLKQSQIALKATAFGFVQYALQEKPER